jgi:hypothetical protein
MTRIIGRKNRQSRTLRLPMHHRIFVILHKTIYFCHKSGAAPDQHKISTNELITLPAQSHFAFHPFFFLLSTEFWYIPSDIKILTPVISAKAGTRQIRSQTPAQGGGDDILIVKFN